MGRHYENIISRLQVVWMHSGGPTLSVWLAGSEYCISETHSTPVTKTCAVSTNCPLLTK